MPLDQLLVFLIIAAAAAYLVWRSRRRKGGCGSCSSGDGCGAPKPESDRLVQLDTRPRRRK